LAVETFFYFHLEKPMSCESYEVKNWLNKFTKCVRKQDFSGGRALFSEKVRSFGTVARRAKNLDELVETQWLKVWPKTENFRFVEESLNFFDCGESAVCVFAEWVSEGYEAGVGKVERTGRCTVVLGREGEELLCCHTHFSIAPDSGRDCVLD
jgi:ketosteroid isomerase-like protein